MNNQEQLLINLFKARLDIEQVNTSWANLQYSAETWRNTERAKAEVAIPENLYSKANEVERELGKAAKAYDYSLIRYNYIFQSLRLVSLCQSLDIEPKPLTNLLRECLRLRILPPRIEVNNEGKPALHWICNIFTANETRQYKIVIREGEKDDMIYFDQLLFLSPNDLYNSTVWKLFVKYFILPADLQLFDLGF